MVNIKYLCGLNLYFFREKNDETEDKPKEKTKGKDDYTTEEKALETDLEEKKSGSLGWKFFVDYFLLSGSNLRVIFWVIFVGLTQAAYVLVDISLASFGTTGDQEKIDCEVNESCDLKILNEAQTMRSFYLYVGVLLAWIFIGILTSIQFVKNTMRSSQNVHDVSLVNFSPRIFIKG